LLKSLFNARAGREAGAHKPPAAPSGPRVPRRSGAWAIVHEYLRQGDARDVLDIGPTSSSCINLMTGMGCNVYTADPLYDLATSEWTGVGTPEAEPLFDVDRFRHQSLQFSGRNFDVILLWDTLEYLPQELQQPMIDRIYEVLRPGGKLLAYFHPKLDAPNSSHHRFHPMPGEMVEAQRGSGYGMLRTFQNRQIDTLFQKFSNTKSLIAQDGLREVVVTR
jgi:hypothetical protein